MIENDQQLDNTLAKLALLQRPCDEARADPEQSYARELTVQSLKRRINRFTEEMLRYTAQQTEMARR